MRHTPTEAETWCMNTHTPRQVADDLQAHPKLPKGTDERYAGYGVMGTPFSTGHYLAFREMDASSIGPAFRTIWHRDPQGRWDFHTTTSPELSCPRYFGAGAVVTQVPQISVHWGDDWSLTIEVGSTLRWHIVLASSPATRAMTTMSAAMPAGAWNSSAVLSSMGPMARTMLRSGRIRLCGRTPNGPSYKAAPLHVWRVADTDAQCGGEDVGTPAPLAEPTRLGDFWLPQRGLFFAGKARFSSARGATAA